MLRVEENPPPFGAEELDRVADHREVLLARRAQCALDVTDVRLGDQRDDAASRRRRSARTCGSSAATDAGLAGRAESGELRVPQRQLAGGRAAEERLVLGVGARPAALDETDAEVVEVRGDRELVLDRQRQTFTLRAVAQRRVVDVEACRGCPSENGFPSWLVHSQKCPRDREGQQGQRVGDGASRRA